MLVRNKRTISGILIFLLMASIMGNLIGTNVISADDNTTIFMTDFSNPSQILNQYGAFYGTRDVWNKNGNGDAAKLNLSIANINGPTGVQSDPAMYVSEKTDWARPIIRFNHNFIVGKTYFFEYDIKKTIDDKKIRVDSLIQITGSKDSDWPSAPDVFLDPVDIGNSWQKISFEMKISLSGEQITFTINDKTTKLPVGAAIAAIDYSISTSGDDSITPYYVDNFKVSEKRGVEYPTDPNVTKILETDFEASGQYADSYFDYSQNKWMKVGNGNSAVGRKMRHKYHHLQSATNPGFKQIPARNRRENAVYFRLRRG